MLGVFTVEPRGKPLHFPISFNTYLKSIIIFQKSFFPLSFNSLNTQNALKFGSNRENCFKIAPTWELLKNYYSPSLSLDTPSKP